MQVSVTERLILLGLLPEQGDFTTLRIVRELRESLSFSEEEHEALGFEVINDGQQVRWNKEAAEIVKDVSLGPRATDLIVSRLKSLDQEHHLTEQHMPLYERFVGAPET